MSESKQRARGRERPSLPDPPFLCADCRHGSVIVQKLQPWLLAQEAWQDGYPDLVLAGQLPEPQGHALEVRDLHPPRRRVRRVPHARDPHDRGRRPRAGQEGRAEAEAPEGAQEEEAFGAEVVLRAQDLRAVCRDGLGPPWARVPAAMQQRGGLRLPPAARRYSPGIPTRSDGRGWVDARNPPRCRQAARGVGVGRLPRVRNRGEDPARSAATRSWPRAQPASSPVSIAVQRRRATSDRMPHMSGTRDRPGYEDRPPVSGGHPGRRWACGWSAVRLAGLAVRAGRRGQRPVHASGRSRAGGVARLGLGSAVRLCGAPPPPRPHGVGCRPSGGSPCRFRALPALGDPSSWSKPGPGPAWSWPTWVEHVGGGVQCTCWSAR